MSLFRVYKISFLFLSGLAFSGGLSPNVQVADGKITETKPSSPSLSAPNVKTQDQIFYPDRAGHDWVYLPSSARRGIIYEFAENTYPASLASEMGQGDTVCASLGYLWTCSMKVRESDFDYILYRKKLGALPSEWERVGKVNPSNGFPTVLIPLKDGNKFMGIARNIGFTESKGDGASFVALYELKNDVLEFLNCLEMPFDTLKSVGKKKTFTIPWPSGDSSNKPATNHVDYCEIIPSSLIPSLWIPSISSDYVAIAASTSGVIWIYDLKSGALKNTINLFSTKVKDVEKFNRLKHLILGTSFSPDGSLIVASRHPDFVSLTAKIEETSTDASDNKKMFETLAKQFNEIQWWEIDPVSGTQTKLDNPIDFPATSKSFSQQSTMMFLVDGQKRVRTNAFTPWDRVKEEVGIKLSAPPGVNVKSTVK